MADYDPATVGAWNGDEGYEWMGDGQQANGLISTDQNEDQQDQEKAQANDSLDLSTRAAGDSQPVDGPTNDVGDYDPTVVSAALVASEPQSRAALKPSPQPATKKPRTAGGFLVGSSDSEDDDDDAPKIVAKKVASVTQSQDPPATPSLQNSLSAEPSRDASNPPAIQVNQTAAAPVGGSVSRPAAPVPAAAPSVVPVQTIPQDRIQFLDARVREDPRGATAQWLELMSEHRARNDILGARQVYTRFLEIFPQAADVWVAYLDMELEMGNFSEAEEIFGKCLTDTLNVTLWTRYLDYIRRRNPVTLNSPAARQTVSDAYKFVLEHIGCDKDSGKIWSDYIQFLKSGPGKVGGNDWQDQQKMDQLRAAYQQATSVPTESVNVLWKEYGQFEQDLNRLTSRQYLAARSPIYMAAKSAVTALKNVTQGLQRTNIPQLPPAPGFDGDREFMEQVDIWKRWIAYEKDDPLANQDDQPELVKKRILYTYKQALMALRFWPEMWADAAQWCIDNNISNNITSASNDGGPLGVDLMIRGIAANPESTLLAFKHGEYIELTFPAQENEEGKIAKGKAVRAPYQRVLDTLYGMVKSVKDREVAEIARIEAAFAAEIEALSNTGNTGDDDEDEANFNAEKEAKEEQKKTQISAIQKGNHAHGQLLSRTISFVWIALMRAMRRIQGKGDPKAAMGGMRAIFQDARTRGKLTSDVYIASARMEWLIYKDKVGGKIFERGARLFPEDENYTLEYIKHLHATDDFTNARVLFETFVNRLSQKPENVHKTKPLLAYFHKFESQYGELSQIKKLEQRMAELFPNDPTLAHFNSRFSTEVFDPIAVRLIISPATQLRPKKLPVLETMERTMSQQQNSPRPLQFSTLNSPRSPRPMISQAINSPKRPLPMDDFEDGNPPRKMMRNDEYQRGASPLKGAAGRRLRHLHGNTGSSYQAAPAPVGRDITFMMNLTPRADTYRYARFDPNTLVRVLRNTAVPGDAPAISNDWRSGVRDSPNRYHRQGSARPGSSGSYEPPPAQSGYVPPPPPPGQFDPAMWQQLGIPPPPVPHGGYPPPPGYPQMPMSQMHPYQYPPY